MKKLTLLALFGFAIIASSSLFASGIDTADDVIEPVALMEDDGTDSGYVLPKFEDGSNLKYDVDNLEADIDELNEELNLN